MGIASAKRTTFVELFFDLVFVFAITQVASVIRTDHSVTGWLQAAMLLWLVWWAWSQYTWAANAIDVERATTQVALLVVTGCTLVAAVALPTAFGADGALFAVPYTVVRFAGLGLYWHGLRGDPDHQAALRAYLPVAVASPALVLAGGLAPTAARPWLWLAAVAVDVASVLAAGRGEFRVAPGHFAERHGLIVIIALGESVIEIGAAAAGAGLGTVVLLSLALAFTATALLWWTYFGGAAERLEGALVALRDGRARGHMARDVFTLGHLPMVAGIILFAVGAEEVLLHPGELAPLPACVALGVGLALFLVAFAAVRWRGVPIAAGPRRAAMAVVALAIIPLLATVPGWAALAIVVAVLLVAAPADRMAGAWAPAPARQE